MNAAPAPVALARFQSAFARALLHDEEIPDAAVADLVGQPAFAVYRNTVMKGCLDALQANFPAVARLVGEEWFRAAAAVFAAGELPREASLLRYGERFPEFLAGFPPAADLPYLAAVARLDRLWIESHAAADHDALDPAAIAALGPEALAATVLEPHPAARWAWSPEAPAFTIWRANREEGTGLGEIDWRGEGALLTRPQDAVRATPLDEAGCRFLDACARGLPVTDALDAALAADAATDFARLAATLLEAGAFARLVPIPHADSGRTSP